MAILRNHIHEGFTKIPNDIISDDRLSAMELRLYLYIISKPGNWQINNTHIMKSLSIGSANTLAKYWNKLLDLKLLERVPIKGEKGRFGGFDYTVLPYQSTVYQKPIHGDNSTVYQSAVYGQDRNGASDIHNNTDIKNKTDFNQNELNSMSEVEKSTSDEGDFPNSEISTSSYRAEKEKKEKVPAKRKKALKERLMKEVQYFEVPPEETIYFEIAEAFRKLFLENQRARGATTKTLDAAKYGNFVNPVRLMLEQDGVTREQLQRVFKFLGSEQGEFWKPNILSTDKLRKQIDQLTAKAIKDKQEIRSEKAMQRMAKNMDYRDLL